jgi:Protein of unknown function (DUF2971)
MNAYKFVRPEDIEEYWRFCLHHARSFGRALREELWHYTDANGLIGILQSGKVWTTQVSCLNDTLEQRYFSQLIHRAVKERRKQNADFQLEPLFRVADEALGNLDFTAMGQFVTCFSEAEDDLAQWRGYGGGECGYAIGFRSQAFLEVIKTRPNTLLLPMGYADDIHNFIVADVMKWSEIYFRQGLARGVSDPVAWATEFVAAFGDVLNIIAATVKHPKFSGEFERRIATLLQDGEHSQLVFRQKRTLLARHLPLSLTVEIDGAQRLPISRIYVGPGPSQTVSKISVGDPLIQQGYSGVPVEISKVPYRVP